MRGLNQLICSLLSCIFIINAQVLNAQEDFYNKLADAAFSLTKEKVVYDPSYYSIPYPMGDIPDGKGVCTDLVIRAYRILGIDLQEMVHKDMTANFKLYPRNWGLSGPDTNIDHRRVPNLMKFFERKGEILAMTTNAEDYSPGDIVCWDLGNGITHIGIVAGKKTTGGKRYQVVHNIGSGQVMEDVLFEFRIIGHYRYKNKNPGA